jgi:hypothetical protein
MDVVVISNGLGNQMSQFAFYLQKRAIDENVIWIVDKNSAFDHNGFELDKVFGINYQNTFRKEAIHLFYRICGIKKYKFLSKPLLMFLKFCGITIIEEDYHYNFNHQILNSSGGTLTFYKGGWHSPHYFKAVASEVRRLFKFNHALLDSVNLTYAKSILDSSSVSIHVRRGDYFNSTNYQTFGKVCTIEYYAKAIKELEKSNENLKYFIFTNDSEWVIKNFDFIDFELIDHNKGSNSWIDMYLMSLCKHHVNANSTFSWWGAWLSDYKSGITIVPREFIYNREFVDIYPEAWTKIPTSIN